MSISENKEVENLTSIIFEVQTKDNILTKNIDPENKKTEIIYDNGDQYIGPIKDINLEDFSKHGKDGKYSSTINNFTYEGSFSNDNLHGKGNISINDNESYSLNTDRGQNTFFKNNEILFADEIRIIKNRKEIMVNLKSKSKGENNHYGEITYFSIREKVEFEDENELYIDEARRIYKIFIGYLDFKFIFNELFILPTGLGRLYEYTKKVKTDDDVFYEISKITSNMKSTVDYFNQMIQARMFRKILLGEFKNGELNGYGVRLEYHTPDSIRDAHKSISLGKWENGKLNGYGKNITFNINENPKTYIRYVGFWKNNNRIGTRAHITETDKKKVFCGNVKDNARDAGGTIHYGENDEIHLHNGQWGISYNKKGNLVSKPEGLSIFIYKSPKYIKLLKKHFDSEKKTNKLISGTIPFEPEPFDKLRKTAGLFGFFKDEKGKLKSRLIDGIDFTNFGEIYKITRNGELVEEATLSPDNFPESIKHLLILGEDFYNGIKNQPLSIDSYENEETEFLKFETMATLGDLNGIQGTDEHGLIDHIRREYSIREGNPEEGIGIVSGLQSGGKINKSIKKINRKRNRKTKKRQK